MSLQSLILLKINKNTLIKNKYLYNFYNKEYNYIQVLKQYIDIKKINIDILKIIKHKISVRMLLYLIKYNLLSNDYIDMYKRSLKYMNHSWCFGCINFRVNDTTKIWYLITNTNIPVMIHNDDKDENDKLKPAIINNNYKKCYVKNKYIYEY